MTVFDVPDAGRDKLPIGSLGANVGVAERPPGLRADPIETGLERLLDRRRLVCGDGDLAKERDDAVLAPQLGANVLVQPPRDDAHRSGTHDEHPVDGRPSPWMVDRPRMVVDRRRGERSRDSVVRDDVRERQEEGEPVLVEGDDGDHHEEVEMRLDHAAGSVNQQHRGRQQTDRDQRGTRPPAATAQRSEHRARGERRAVTQGVKHVVALERCVDGEAGRVEPQQSHQRPVAALPDIVRERPSDGQALPDSACEPQEARDTSAARRARDRRSPERHRSEVVTRVDQARAPTRASARSVAERISLPSAVEGLDLRRISFIHRLSSAE
jgi:hypothetical protein